MAVHMVRGTTFNMFYYGGVGFITVYGILRYKEAKKYSAVDNFFIKHFGEKNLYKLSPPLTGENFKSFYTRYLNQYDGNTDYSKYLDGNLPRQGTRKDLEAIDKIESSFITPNLLNNISNKNTEFHLRKRVNENLINKVYKMESKLEKNKVKMIYIEQQLNNLSQLPKEEREYRILKLKSKIHKLMSESYKYKSYILKAKNKIFDKPYVTWYYGEREHIENKIEKIQNKYNPVIITNISCFDYIESCHNRPILIDNVTISKKSVELLLLCGSYPKIYYKGESQTVFTKNIYIMSNESSKKTFSEKTPAKNNILGLINKEKKVTKSTFWE
jgi:hypothetical protein